MGYRLCVEEVYDQGRLGELESLSCFQDSLLLAVEDVSSDLVCHQLPRFSSMMDSYLSGTLN